MNYCLSEVSTRILHIIQEVFTDVGVRNGHGE